MNRKHFLFALGLPLALGLGCRLSPPVTPSSSKNGSTLRSVRANCYSLLSDLLGKERHVTTILIIKEERRELKALIKRIAETSGRAADQIKAFAKTDPALSLDRLLLPVGEVAVRDAIEKTSTDDLLHASGKDFEVKLLLTQTEALNYAAHLAQVAAVYEPDARQARTLQNLGREFQQLRQEAVSMLRFSGS